MTGMNEGSTYFALAQNSSIRSPLGQSKCYPRPPAVPLSHVPRVSFLVALVLLCALAFGTAPAAFAADTNVVGETITVTIPESDNSPGSGTLEFSITTVAPDEETPGAVRLNSGTTYKGELALDKVEYGGFLYAVTSVRANAFKGNTALTGIEFRSDLTDESSPTGAIGDSAFEGCSNLASIVFPQKVAGIGDYVFRNCTSLSTVTFAEGAELYAPSRGIMMSRFPAIGRGAFEGCSVLKEITIPAITSTQRSGDRYSTYGDTTNSTPVSGPNPSMYSGYQNAFNPGSTVPVYSRGIEISAFKNCESLETVIFEPSGAPWGLFAYFTQETDHPVFEGCSALKTVVYGDEQPYYADYDRAVLCGYTPTYRNVYAASGVAPALYYAIDYYATAVESDASSDDGFASGRYARVEYLRHTPTAALATSDAAVLADAVYADSSAYVQDGYLHDGVIPDPKAVAVEVGFDTADTDKEWVWKLGGTQSRRAGLSDSCYAYLAEADDLSAGRVGASQIAALYKLCGQNLSQGQEPVKDSPFDAARYYTYTSVGFDRYYFNDSGANTTTGRPFLDEGETAWFTLTSTVEQSFFSQIEVYAPDGTLLGEEDYGASFERYDTASGGLVPAMLGEQDGPLLMTITPSEESSYKTDSTLKEWVLVKGHAGSARTRYTTDPTHTWRSAVYYNGTSVTSVSPFIGPYAVAISSADPSSALIAASYTGLTSAPINVRDTASTSYGFAVSTDFNSLTGRINSNADLTNFPSTDFSPSEFAVAAYEIFEERQRDLLGATAYPWGDTAIVITPDSVQEVAGGVAAYAYAKKAPVFYTEDDGSVSEDTLACLRDFKKVVALGDEGLFSAAAYHALRAALQPSIVAEALQATSGITPLGTDSYADLITNLADGDQEPEVVEPELQRIEGAVAGSATSLSLKVAALLLAEDPSPVNPSTVAIIDVTDVSDQEFGAVADILGALNLSGHEGGLTLVTASTADSKQISTFLRELQDEVNLVRLFGRETSQLATSSFDTLGSLQSLWSAEPAYTAATPEIGTGDTLVLNGVLFEITDEGEGETLSFVERLWEGPALEAGNISYGDKSFALSETEAEKTVTATDPPDASPDKPTLGFVVIKPKPPVEDPVPDPTEIDPVPTPPAETPDPNTKEPGRLVVTTPQVASSQTGGTLVSTGSSSNSNNTNTGTLGVSQMTVADSDGEETNALADRRQSTPRDVTDFATDSASDDAIDATETPTDQPRGTNPVLAAALIGSAVAALAVALWFALRRRKPVPALATPEGPAPPEDPTPPEDLMEE